MVFGCVDAHAADVAHVVITLFAIKGDPPEHQPQLCHSECVEFVVECVVFNLPFD